MWRVGGGRIRQRGARDADSEGGVADPDPLFLGHPDPNPVHNLIQIRIVSSQTDSCKSFFSLKHCLKHNFDKIIFYLNFECQNV